MKVLYNLRSILLYQNFFIIFFRLTKLHKIGGILWYYAINIPQKKYCLATAKVLKIDFSQIIKYHRGNYIDLNENWHLNGVNHGKNLHIGKMEHDDYTRQLVYSYLEWVFSTDRTFDTKKLNSLVKVSTESSFSNEPSSVSLRIYPLLYALKSGALDKTFIETQLKTCFHSLQKNIELSVGANHLIDNFISLSILSILFQQTKIAKFYIFLLRLSLSHGTKNGYYEEKNPVYSAGLSIRLQILLDILGGLKEKPCRSLNLASELELYNTKLLNYPCAPVNDSYLPSSSLFKNQETLENENYVPDYFVSKKFGSILCTIILNSVGNRGYTAHCHDASMSLFLLDLSSHLFLMTSQGTPCYSAGDIRDLSRFNSKYPGVSCGIERQVKGVGSFRLTEIYKPKVVSTEHLKFVDKASNLEYKLENSKIIIRSGKKESKFSFYSDVSGLGDPMLKNIISFKNFIEIDETVDERYDGIYNNKKCYRYIVLFDFEMEIVIKV